ncbi:hypothetical protein PM082_014172 [Marasmius tenuissimus]|nr:hypothetical protein PM082_014172 [Marasmius tenuissimus]
MVDMPMHRPLCGRKGCCSVASWYGPSHIYTLIWSRSVPVKRSALKYRNEMTRTTPVTTTSETRHRKRPRDDSENFSVSSSSSRSNRSPPKSRRRTHTAPSATATNPPTVGDFTPLTEPTQTQTVRQADEPRDEATGTLLLIRPRTPRTPPQSRIARTTEPAPYNPWDYVNLPSAEPSPTHAHPAEDESYPIHNFRLHFQPSVTPRAYTPRLQHEVIHATNGRCPDISDNLLVHLQNQFVPPSWAENLIKPRKDSRLPPPAPEVSPEEQDRHFEAKLRLQSYLEKVTGLRDDRDEKWKDEWLDQLDDGKKEREAATRYMVAHKSSIIRIGGIRLEDLENLDADGSHDENTSEDESEPQTERGSESATPPSFTFSFPVEEGHPIREHPSLGSWGAKAFPAEKVKAQRGRPRGRGRPRTARGRGGRSRNVQGRGGGPSARARGGTPSVRARGGNQNVRGRGGNQSARGRGGTQDPGVSARGQPAQTRAAEGNGRGRTRGRPRSRPRGHGRVWRDVRATQDP